MSRPIVEIRAAALRDIEEHYRWLAKEAGLDVADRFLAAADHAFRRLAERPGIGPSIPSSDPRIARLRKGKVGGFPNVLVFYEPRPSGVSVVRVVHAAQDWWSLIGAD